MGALTIGTVPSQTGGASLMRARFLDVTVIPFTFTMSASYATNGDTGLVLPKYKDLVAVMIPPTGGYSFALDVPNAKIKAFTSGGTETTPATNLSTLGAITGFLWVRM